MERYVIPSIFGQDIGIIVEGKNGIQFQYSDTFDGEKLPLSPFKLPYDPQRVFTLHDALAFDGLPGIFYDSLPDRFGSIIMDHYLSQKYGSAARLSVIDKLLYVGSYGMGAISYRPALREETSDGIALRRYINEVRHLIEGKPTDVLNQITQHPSPGGARPKAAVMWNRRTDTIKVGDFCNDDESEAWIVKFDEAGREDTLVEYTYMKTAQNLGITVPPIVLFDMHGENHFAIRRFDRTPQGAKLHMATLAGLLHLDFNVHVSTSYEMAMRIALALTRDHQSVKEIFRRMVFNVIGRNCDDHSKNLSFLMDETGSWKLAPAYDLLYNYGPATFGQHRMSVNHKVDHITVEDLAQCGYESGLALSFMKETVEKISDHFGNIEHSLLAQGVSKGHAQEIAKNIKPLSTDRFPTYLKSKSKSGKKQSMDPLTKSILDKI